MDRLELYTLGKVAITLNGKAIETRLGTKGQALLIYLVNSATQNFSRSHLWLLLWGEKSGKQAAQNLRTTLRRLKQVLPPEMLDITRQSIGFNQHSNYLFDVEKLATSIDFYQGAFLEGLDVAEAPLWDEWVYAQREIIDTHFLEQLAVSAETALRAKQPDQAIGYFQRMLGVDAWREQVHRQLMLAYWKAGDRGAALAQYQQCEQILQDELGTIPSAETSTLYQRIVGEQDADLHNLPLSEAETPFFGRQQTLDTLSQQIIDPNCRIMTVTGLGGTGKTRLALQLARDRQLDFPDGVWMVELAGVDGDHLLNAIVDTLKIPISGTTSLRRRLLSYLKTRHLLLVLDNFEHLLAHAAVVETILHAAPQVKLLITSRERLNLRSEWVYQLSGLSLEETTAAIQLFVFHAQRSVAHFALDAGNQAAIKQICHLVEGMPLALEMAAALLRVLSPAELAAELARDLALLEASEQDVPQRQRNLGVIFEYAYERLSAEEQRVLRELSLLGGSFERKAATTITQASIFTLASLVDKSLLYRVAGNRLRLHEQTRQFAEKILRQQLVELDRVKLHFAQYFMGKLAGALSRIKSEEQQSVLADLQLGREHLVAAWRWCLQAGQTDLLLEAEETLYYFYKIQEQYYEAEGIFRQAIAMLSKPPLQDQQFTDTIRGRLQLRLGAILSDRVFETEAEQLLQDGLRLVGGGEDSAEFAFATNYLGNVYFAHGNLDKADHCFRQSLAYYQAHSDWFEQAGCLNHLGYLAFTRDEIEEAQTVYQRATLLYEVVGDMSNVALMQYNLAYVEEALGNKDRAKQLLKQSVGQLLATDNVRYIYTSLHSLSINLIYSELPLPDNSEHYLTTALSEAQADGDRFSSAWLLGQLGALYSRLGDVEIATRHLNRALLELQRLEMPMTLIMLCRIRCATVALSSYDVRSARTHLHAVWLWISDDMPDYLLSSMSLLSALVFGLEAALPAALQVAYLLRKHGNRRMQNSLTHLDFLELVDFSAEIRTQSQQWADIHTFIDVKPLFLAA